jgi:hypothetical protein
METDILRKFRRRIEAFKTKIEIVEKLSMRLMSPGWAWSGMGMWQYGGWIAYYRSSSIVGFPG